MQRFGRPVHSVGKNQKQELDSRLSMRQIVSFDSVDFVLLSMSLFLCIYIYIFIYYGLYCSWLWTPAAAFLPIKSPAVISNSSYVSSLVNSSQGH